MKKAIAVPSLKQHIRKSISRQGLKIPNVLLTDDQKFLRNAAKVLTRSDVVIDLGAHIGEASIEFSHRAGKVYAFEPHPAIFEELTRNTANYKNIIPVQKAASDVTGTADLFFDDHPKAGRFTEGSSLAEGKSNLSYSKSYTVGTVNIADFIRELGQPVRMIKMDVEGFEYRLIGGLLDGEVMDLIGMVHVEDHCDRIEGLAQERDKILSRIDAAGLQSKFDFEWP